MKYILLILLVLILHKMFKRNNIEKLTQDNGSTSSNFSEKSSLPQTIFPANTGGPQVIYKEEDWSEIMENINTNTNNGTENLDFLRNNNGRKNTHIYLGNKDDKLMNYSVYADERSTIGINSYTKDESKLNEQKNILINEISTLIPNIKCSNNKDPYAEDTCNDDELELDEPSNIKLEYQNKPLNSLDPNDTNNYCNKNILKCGCNPFLDTCEGQDADRNDRTVYSDICKFHYQEIKV